MLSKTFHVFTESLDYVKIDTRIVGGSDTTIEQYPYQVSIIYIDSHYCGGSLIHPQYVLTAAHCTEKFPSVLLLVRAGSTHVDQGGVVRTVEKIYLHPEYDPDTDNNDISVIKLHSRFILGKSINIVSLPKQDELIEDNQEGIATGWGRLSENGVIPLELQHVRLTTISRDKCELLIGKITRNMLCAGNLQGGQDTCQGDSGGPFVVKRVLVGVTSWGYGCAQKKHAGVYTDVSRFTNYITNIINN